MCEEEVTGQGDTCAQKIGLCIESTPGDSRRRHAPHQPPPPRHNLLHKSNCRLRSPPVGVKNLTHQLAVKSTTTNFDLDSSISAIHSPSDSTNLTIVVVCCCCIVFGSGSGRGRGVVARADLDSGARIFDVNKPIERTSRL
eukprot:scaffold1618_cov196-Alexandrium_tamarense.AAC.21